MGKRKLGEAGTTGEEVKLANEKCIVPIHLPYSLLKSSVRAYFLWFELKRIYLVYMYLMYGSVKHAQEMLIFCLMMLILTVH